MRTTNAFLHRLAVVAIVTIILGLLTLNTDTYGFSHNQYAAIAIGQRKPSSYGGLDSQGGLAFDTSGNLWIADTYNNRVLKFVAPFGDDMSPSLVIGQKGFQTTRAGLGSSILNSPADVAFDSRGDLWVSDLVNNRVLGFEPPFRNGANASIVIGQTNFLSNWHNATRNQLNSPYAIAFDSSNDLWVADAGNNRILEFDPPFSSGMNASLVIGEQDFVTVCESECASNSVLNGPWRVTFDPNGDLWVGEGYGGPNRLLEFKQPFRNGMSPSLEINQTSLNSTYGEPVDLAVKFDPNGNLWMGYWGEAPSGGIFEFTPPIGKDMKATVKMAGYPGNWYSRSLSAPTGLAFDSAGNLWAVDWGTSWGVDLAGRILGFDAQVHSVKGMNGLICLRNQEGLLYPLSTVPVRQIGTLVFPEGLLNFSIQGLPAGGSVKLTITFPDSLSSGVNWVNIINGNPLGSGAVGWSQLPASQVQENGNNMTLTLGNASQEGFISVVGGPALPSTETPSVSVVNSTGPPQSSSLSSLISVPVTIVLLAIGFTLYRKRSRKTQT